MKAMLHDRGGRRAAWIVIGLTHRFLLLRSLNGLPFPMIHRVQP
nr:hypothetical protein [uncultured Noviherbaspirillum sp.]